VGEEEEGTIAVDVVVEEDKAPMATGVDNDKVSSCGGEGSKGLYCASIMT